MRVLEEPTKEFLPFLIVHQKLFALVRKQETTQNQHAQRKPQRDGGPCVHIPPAYANTKARVSV